MSNKKEVPKQTFSGELKKAKNITPTGSPPGHPVEGNSWCLFPNYCP
jgi:hypothetical protein